MILILAKLILVILLSFSVALLTWLLDFCLGDLGTAPEPRHGRIFSRIGWKIFRGYLGRQERIANAEREALLMAHTEIESMDASRTIKLTEAEKKAVRVKLLEKVSKVNWWKILGVCPICSNVWLCFLLYPGVALLLSLSPGEIAAFAIPFVVFSNGLLRRILGV